MGRCIYIGVDGDKNAEINQVNFEQSQKLNEKLRKFKLYKSIRDVIGRQIS